MSTSSRRRQRSSRLLAVVFTVCVCEGLVAEDPQVAFPGAEGFGAFARGGGDGDVYRVINLDDGGAGSLRDAVDSARGPRTIVFDVSGTIELGSSLVIRRPFLTIDGLTAPGGGITLEGWGLIIKGSHDVIVRHIRLRPGDRSCEKGFDGDCLEIRNSKDIMIDHVSMSWSIDEILSIRDSDRVTVQWCFLTESLNKSCHPKGPHSTATLLGPNPGGKVTVHHCLFAHHVRRSPKPTSRGGTMHFQFENNVVYDWGTVAGYTNTEEFGEDLIVRFVGNHLIAGPSTSTKPSYTIEGQDTGSHAGIHEIAFRGESPQVRVFQEGNVIDSDRDKTANPRDTGWSMFAGPFTRIPDSPGFPDLGSSDAVTACEEVLSGAGASHVRDAVDERIVRQVRERSGRIIDSQNDVGGWPLLPGAALTREIRPGDGEECSRLQTSLLALFDRCASKVRAARASKPVENLTGGIVWGNSYELDAYLEIFLATGKRDYLDQFVALAEAVCAARADRTGELDFRGHLRRGWLTAGHYTWSQPAVLLDETGSPSLELVTSQWAYNNFLSIELLRAEGHHFDIIVRDQRDNSIKGEFRDLTMETAEREINPAPEKRGVLRARRLGDRPPRSQTPFTPPPAKTVLHGHHTGKIISPLARFAAIVKTHPELEDLKQSAEGFLQCAEEVVPELEQSWTDLGDRGYYRFEKGIPFWCDGIPEPHNVLAHTGSAFVWLYEATGKEFYRQRARQLATLIRSNLEPLPDGTWMFHYWFGVVHDGWKPEDQISTNQPAWRGNKTPEDVSHLQLTLRFMHECAERGWVFQNEDLLRFARTFHQRLWSDSPLGGTLWDTMEGSGGGKQGGHDRDIYGFIQLGRIDPDVYERCRSMYEKQQAESGSSSALYGWALLNRIAKELASLPSGTPVRLSE